MDLISIVVPIHNVGAYLYQCVHSIVGQSYRNLEIILVNDGSTDSSVEICEYFRKADARIRVITQSNGGLVFARKIGLNSAKGKYVFYVDGDDWIESDCLSNYYDLAVQHDADIVIGDYNREFLGNFLTLRNSISPGIYGRERIEKNILPAMISQEPFFNHGLKTYSWGKLYLRSLIMGLQDEVPNNIVVGEDAALVYPAIARSSTLVISEMALYNYRQRPNSILKSTHFNPEEFERIAATFRYLTKALDSQHSPHGLEQQLKAYFVAIVTLRAGGFLSSKVLYDKFSVFGPLPQGARLAVYDSGSFGQHVFKQLQKSDSFVSAGWYDKDYRESQMLRMSVNDPEALAYACFDYLLIPSFDSALLAEVSILFKKLSLDLNKIRTVDVAPECFDFFIKTLGYEPRTFNRMAGFTPFEI